MTGILQGLDSKQQEAAGAGPGPVCIIAGAGCGKTTTLAARVAHLSATGQWEEEKVLALTHSTKAAGALRDKLLRLGGKGVANSRTFHSLALEICKEFWADSGRPGSEVKLVTNTYPLVRAAARLRGRKEPETSHVTDLAAEIGWAKASIIPPEEYEKKAQGRSIWEYSPSEVARVYKAYENALAKAGQVDFSDLLLIAIHILESSEEAAKKVREQHKHILVDEYQDTDASQQALLACILGEREDITVVGDPRQAIYGFKGGDPGLLGGFQNKYKNSTTITLVTDYRSKEAITKAANSLMQTPASAALIAGKEGAGEIEVIVGRDEAGEAGLVARRVKGLLQEGVSAKQIAILYRYNSQSALFEQALTSARVPYQIADGKKFFERDEIIAVLRFAWRKMQEAERGGEEAGGLQVVRESLTYHGFDKTSPPGDAGGARERWEAYAALEGLVETISKNMKARELLEELALRKKQAHEVATSLVTLSTVHKAKGLEWEWVFLARMVEGSMPSSYAKTAKDLEEEKRLAYVGLTRAGDGIVLSYSTRRGGGEKTWPATPSPYLDMMGAHPQQAKTLHSSARTKASAAPKTASTLGAEDQRLFGELKKWRKSYAKTKKMPDFTIIGDKELEAVAVRRPKTRAELLKVPGIGLRKTDAFGSEILQVVQQH